MGLQEIRKIVNHQIETKSEEDMRIEYDRPSAKSYTSLRIKSGMGEKNQERTAMALQNSLFTVSIYEDNGGSLIGFGRIVGDGGITYVISDIMVDPKYQRQGYGTIIMQEIDQYLSQNTYEDSYICLIANSPADKLYNKFKFSYLPDNKCGMLRDQKKNLFNKSLVNPVS